MEGEPQSLVIYLAPPLSSPMMMPTLAPSLFMGDDGTILVVVGSPQDQNADDISNDGGGSKNSMDVLAAVFFAIAATWLLFALMYASLVLLFLRIRARGDLDRIYEADFGRLYICGTRFYISLGWLLRRYIRHIHPHPQYPDGGPSKLMTRKERRDAMEVLLMQAAVSRNNASAADTAGQTELACGNCTDEEMQREGDGISIEGPVCSICLAEYDEGEDVVGEVTCSHKFHKECILDWLQRQNIAECPCCRVPMVAEEAVWNAVRTMRDKSKAPKASRKKQLAKSSTLPSSASASSLSSSFDELPNERGTERSASHLESRSPEIDTATDLDALRNMASCVSVASEDTINDEGAPVSLCASIYSQKQTC